MNVEDSIVELSQKGYVILPDVIPQHECEKMGEVLDTLEAEQASKSNNSLIETNTRQRQLLNIHYLYPEIFLQHIANPKIMSLVGKVLNDKFILSNFNASRALKNNNNAHRVHIDSRKPNPSFQHTYQIVANIAIDDFTMTNGGTVVVEGSHLSGQDPRTLEVTPESLTTAVAPKGSVVFITGQTWHDIGNNSDGKRRWSIIAYYSCWWIKPTYDFVTSCEPDIFDMCSNFQKELLGFNSRPPIDWRKRQLTVSNLDNIPEDYQEALEWDG